MTWQIDGSKAALADALLTGQIALENPAQGLTGLAIDGVSATGRLAGVTLVDASNDARHDARHDASNDARHDATPPPALRWEVEDAYVRGNDLVATYRPQEGMPFRWQVYWRVSPLGDSAAAGLDVVLSVQTPLLETWPAFEVASHLDAHTVELLDRDGVVVGSRGSSKVDGLESTTDFRFVFAQSDGRRSFAEMAHPADFGSCRVTWEGDSGVKTQWRFGTSFMEKGVIRRIQMRTAILPNDACATDARSQLEELVQRPPPLTV
ncbi:hypothetical protein OAS39_11310 [Pirellulales bacterium]|nr:hypothetical protein [Pirellulales bacterium]